MKTFIVKMLLILFFFCTFSQAQNWLQSYDGIPIHTGLWMDWSNVPGALDSMSKIVDVVSADVGIVDTQGRDPSAQIDTLRKYGLKLIPVRTRTRKYSTIHNWIQHYTDAKYCVWEAEGTPTTFGDATLEHNSSVMTEITEGDTTYLKLKETASGLSDTNLVWGPYYVQDIKYYASQNGNLEPVDYTVSYRLKLDYNGGIPGKTDNPNDTVCVIQVTYSTPLGTQGLACTYIVEQDTIIRSRLKNYFKDFELVYRLLDGDCDASSSSEIPQQTTFHSSTRNDTLLPGPRSAREYVEFRVVWLGQPQYLLSIDNVTVSDQRGWELFLDPFRDSHRQKIIDQLNTSDSLNADSIIIGWLGIDEPVSIDIFEPIKLVTQLLDDNSQSKQPLYLPLMGKWDGAWRHHNTFGAMGLSPWTEMKKRIGNMNFWQDFYLYDYPCYEYSTATECQGDWRSTNIWRMAELNYKQAYELNPNFGVSLQCGEVHNTQAYERNIGTHELLYNTNLALMYGAKFLSLYSYFAQRDTTMCDSGWTCHAIIDIIPGGTLNYTPKYYLLKNILKPRLAGLFGKTLKKLTPTDQLLNVESFITYDFLKLRYYMTEYLPGSYDLGFFKDSDNLDYFMLLSRWYNDNENYTITIEIDKTCLGGYQNIQLYNLIDSSKSTLADDWFNAELIRGECSMFRVAPVVKVGGALITNETTLSNETLLYNMSIENGVTLTINGTYYANANITVKTGGKIKYGTDNSKIVFSSGKKLIIEGSAEIKGTSSSNKLTLQYSGTEAILVKSGSSLTMDYCNITGAYQGIVTETGARSYVNISNCTFNTVNTSISLVSSSYTEQELTSQILNCTISSAFPGISVSNYNQILIKGNNLSGCGIYVSNASSAFLQGNIITGGGSITSAGIFMLSSTGYARSNIISNCINGIYLANSSPDIGDNILQNNIKHGLYVGSGSIPNLVGYLQSNPPLYFPLSGYNKIYDNGLSTSSTGDNDGSEIYLANSNILLSNGCNQISDDRQSTPTMNTQYLLSGSLSNGGRQLNAVYNYWGSTTPSSSRFKSLTVIFSPYYIENCPVPDGSGGGGEESLVLKTSDGIIVDTVLSAEGVPVNYSELQVVYSEADNLFATGNVTQAKPLYEQIVAGNYTAKEKLAAYNKLFAIGNLTGEDETYFNSLQNTFEDIANNEADTLIKKVYHQIAIKCDVSKEEYVTAINKFDEIIQQNPNSEEAVYAEIDILTTALNIDTTNTQLGKIGGGKYLVKGTSDYLSKLNDILQSKFGVNSDEKEKIIPKEYSLHQNYPNPFNPSTVISWQSPVSSHQIIKIYDILGKEIATLVDEFKEAGVYEITFDASNLASGVYIYKLQAGDFVSSKKMLLLK